MYPKTNHIFKGSRFLYPFQPAHNPHISETFMFIYHLPSRHFISSQNVNIVLHLPLLNVGFLEAGSGLVLILKFSASPVTNTMIGSWNFGASRLWAGVGTSYRYLSSGRRPAVPKVLSLG